MLFLNGTRHIHYAAAWTLVNAHELACISGMAAAYRLGASYPKELEEDAFALMCFRLYLLLSHGVWYRKGKNRVDKGEEEERENGDAVGEDGGEEVGEGVRERWAGSNWGPGSEKVLRRGVAAPGGK